MLNSKRLMCLKLLSLYFYVFVFRCLVVKHWLNDVDFQYIRGFIYGCLPQEAFVLVTTGLAKLSDVVKNEPATYIFGPKGVGKSYSLIYLACLAEVTVVISPQKPICDVVQYLTHLETQHCKFNWLAAFVWCYYHYCFIQ